MFGERLESKPMAAWLTGAPGVFCPGAGGMSWETVSAEHRREIREMAEAYRERPYPMRTASQFLAFVRTGSRKADEEPYFLRRRKLCVSTLACCTGERTELENIIDGIWCICEETSWVISAHNVNPIPGAPAAAEYPLPDSGKPYIDLFSAQTGMILSYVRRMLGEQLDAVSPVITRRIDAEIDRRILKPFMDDDDFWWMGFRRKDLCNWTPWIVSNAMVCAFLRGMEPKELAELLDRGCRMLDRWLECVPADGGCDEGAGYWNMAGGALLDCLEMLENASDGRFVFWEEEKIRNILSFPGKAAIGNGWFLNFADCDARPFLSGERIQRAGERLGMPELVRLGNSMRGTLADQLNDVPHFTRAMYLLFHPETHCGTSTEPGFGTAPAEKTDPAEENQLSELQGQKGADVAPEETTVPEGDVLLPDLQVRIVRRGGLTLGCKGGHNGESHNHNDVGTFLLFADGEPEIVDAGNMTYTAKTFSEDRYTLWNTRSAYHNLPLIGGHEQHAGPEYRAKDVTFPKDGMRLEMAGAYDPAAKVLQCLREMRLTEEGLTVTDRIETGEAETVSWVFLFRNKPRQNGDRLETERIQLPIPKETETEIEEIPVTDSRMAKSFPGSLWRVRITAAAAVFHEQVWQFQRKENNP